MTRASRTLTDQTHVKDATGQIIQSPARSYGARGVSPQFFLDEKGNILEAEYNTIKAQYRIINNATALNSERAKAIEQRLLILSTNAKLFLAIVKNRQEQEAKFDLIVSTIPTIIGLVIGVGAASGLAAQEGGKALAGKTLATATGTGATLGKILASVTTIPNSVSEGLFIAKINYLEREANALQLIYKDIKGEFLKLDADGTAVQRSANTQENISIAVLIAAVLFIIYKIV